MATIRLLNKATAAYDTIQRKDFYVALMRANNVGDTIVINGIHYELNSTEEDEYVVQADIDCSTNPNYSASKKGYAYRVSVAGKIGGASGKDVNAGDIIICFADSAAGTQAAVGANFTISETNILTMVQKGVQDCSTNPNYPAASQGDVYRVSVAGKIGGASGKDVQVGDLIICFADSAAGTEAAVGANWEISAEVTGLLKSKGVLDCSTNPNYPAASKGDTIRVSVAGKVGGASGKTVHVGDILLCFADSAAGTQATVGANWERVQGKNEIGAALTAQLTTVTHQAPSTPDYAIANLTTTSPWGFASDDEGRTLISVVANLQTRLAEVEARLEAANIVTAN